MGWFNDKKEKGERVPELPELPSLPELPEINKGRDKSFNQLPSFPNSSFGNKFSQSAIKEAVSGEKEGEEDSYADEFVDDEEIQMMHKPLSNPRTMEIKEEGVKEKPLREIKTTKKDEPLFIRLDNFEESLSTFEKTKTKITEIRNMLEDIKKIKEEETNELNTWEGEIKNIKQQIDKIDQDLFSKVE